MRKISFWLGIVGLGFWLLWFLIDTAPSFPKLPPFLFHMLFVFTCLALIIIGLGAVKGMNGKK